MDQENKQDKRKKPFYKKWWFWAIIVILILIFANLGSNDDDDADNAKNNDINPSIQATEGADDIGITGAADTEDNSDTTDTEEDTKQEDTNEITPDDTAVSRDNSSAKLTVLNPGNFVVGTDIPQGRYVITSNESGNLFINSKDGESYINEILGGGELGVESVTTDITEGDTIEISGMDEVTFTPAETELHKDTLSTGNWVVGLDIAPGRYDASSDNNGNFFVYDESGWPVVNEILGGGDIGVEKVTVNLETGYTITVSGMNEVKFKER